MGSEGWEGGFTSEREGNHATREQCGNGTNQRRQKVFGAMKMRVFFMVATVVIEVFRACDAIATGEGRREDTGGCGSA